MMFDSALPRSAAALIRGRSVASRRAGNCYYTDLSPAKNSIYNRAGLLLDATISNFFRYEKYRLRALL